MKGGGGEGAESTGLPFSYRLVRRFYRFLTNIWFREVNVVDDEHLPPDGGRLYITWHPSGLIDPMLMTSVLPGQLTTVAKHTLFDVPLLGRLLKLTSVVPVERTEDVRDAEGARLRNEQRLASLASRLATGGNVLIFPEGSTHSEAGVRRVRSGAARILLAAWREAEATGQPLPNVIPVGLHYSESQRFRERAAVVIERRMELPSPPAIVKEASEQYRLDRAWVQDVTDLFAVELQRVNHSKTSWAERTLIWRGRSLVYAEKQRLAGDQLTKPSFSSSVLAARRLRAGWEFMAEHRPEQTQRLKERCEHHFDVLEQRGITPYDVDSRPEHLSFANHARFLAQWLWALVWMFGLVTWSALAGNLVPYKLNGWFSKSLKRKDIDTSVVGTMKVLSAIVLFPAWWLLASALITWSLLSSASPLNALLLSHWLLLSITRLPAAAVFIVFTLWWPVSARLHLKLYARLVIGGQNLKRWKVWKDDSNDWKALVEEQRALSAELVDLGTGLMLPGDPDWVDPDPGHDDVSAVRFRSAARPS